MILNPQQCCYYEKEIEVERETDRERDRQTDRHRESEREEGLFAHGMGN